MKPELACSTIVFRDRDVFTALDLIASEGFGKVDLCIVPGDCPHFDLENYDQGDVSQLLEHLARRNLSVVALTVIPGFLNARNTDACAELVKRAVDLAAKLGAGLVSLPAGERVERNKWDDSVARVATLLSELAEYAEGFNVEISVEAPHWATLVEDVDDAARFFELVGDQRVGCTFDTSHVARGEKTALREGLQKIGAKRVNHVHLRDVAGVNITVTPGRGHLDFGAFLRALGECSYAGYLTLELEYRAATVRQRQAEIGFARRYLEAIDSGSPLPLDLKIRTTAPIKFLERTVVNPVEEIRRSPQLTDSAKTLRSCLLSLLPVRAYDGHWRNKWYLPNRSRLVVQPRNS
ncbi:MAG: sugar phosphate isomerase/epimerase, partial [Chloroflexota bacterium]